MLKNFLVFLLEALADAGKTSHRTQQAEDIARRHGRIMPSEQDFEEVDRKVIWDFTS